MLIVKRELFDFTQRIPLADFFPPASSLCLQSPFRFDRKKRRLGKRQSMATAQLPQLKMGYHRSLLNEVKLGRGTHMKQLRDELEARPSIKKRYMAERAIELSNAKQREKMMWVKDCDSHVRRVESKFRDDCTFTNPTHTHQVPNRELVERTKKKQEFNRAVAEFEAKKNPQAANSIFC